MRFGRFVALAVSLLAATSLSAATHRGHRLVLPPADCSVAAVPAHAASGTVGGKSFTIAGASLVPSTATVGGTAYDNYFLTLAAPDGAGATMLIVLTASLPQGAPLAGAVFMRKTADPQPEAGAGQPQIPDWGIHYDPGQVDADSLSAQASIHLEFGKSAGIGQTPGKIYFCQGANVVSGSFTANSGD